MTLLDVAHPSLRHAGNPPEWAARGGQWATGVRAWDRRIEEPVFGTLHNFRETTDISLHNGLIDVWVGNRGLAPFLNVQAVSDGEWRNAGTLPLLGDSTEDVLLGASLERITPEVGTVRLICRNAGDIFVSLRRGERGVRIQFGSEFPVGPLSGRYVEWSGMPPNDYVQDAGSAAGKFGDALSGASAYAKFFWPPDLSVDAWSIPLYWLPTATSDTQVDSGLFSLYDADDIQVGYVTYLAATKKIRFTLGANFVESPALTFGALEPISIAAAFDTVTGLGLTTKPDASAVAHASNPAIDPGTAHDTFKWLRLGLAAGGVPAKAGDGNAGDGNAGGVWAVAEGRIDDVKLFADRLSEAERAALAASASFPLEALPVPEGRMVWHAPFDVDPVPVGSALASGRRYETDGAARKSYNGLTRALAGHKGLVETDGLSVGYHGRVFEVFAYLATTEAKDDLADHHAQFAAESEQEVRIR